MKYIRAASSLLLVVGLTYLLNRPLGVVPALGPFLSPFEGFWQNGEAAAKNPFRQLTLTGLKAQVNIELDDNMVPHIFAQNNHDLYLAQGYMTAYHRLWQMEFYARAAGGRLSEVLGARTVEYDRYNRRMGMVYGAERSLAAMMADPVLKEILEAYAEGVNAFIDQNHARDLPVEYKLLGYKPERWSPLHTMLMFKNMTAMLAGGSDDWAMTQIKQKYGQEVVNDLFPNYPTRESPIIPAGTKWDFTPLKPITLASAVAPKVAGRFELDEKPEGIGSNNWAVGGSKSSSGYPILANDPHLQLTLPSIWYQIQLHGPDVNACGVSLPGVPGVTIGFNQDVAWGVTNVDADVMDFYQIKFKDPSMAEYQHGGQWKKTTSRIETIKIKGKADLIDTVFYTHHGPVVYNEGQKPFKKQVPNGYAMRWIGHDAYKDLYTFHLLNRAKNHADYRKALSFYGAPAQNFIYADRHRDIAISANGKYPLKAKEQGKFVMDGTDPANDWNGWIPAEHNPHVKNPPRGFVSSANQSSTDPTYPYYINWRFAPAERGIRINQRLANMQGATLDSLRILQNDNYNVAAEYILPTLLRSVNIKDLRGDQLLAYNAVETWNYDNGINAVGASIFENWLDLLGAAVWEDEFARDGDKNSLRYPTRDRLYTMMLKQPTAKWFDNVATKDKIETMSDDVTLSFKNTIDSLTKWQGPFDAKTWAWNKTKSTDIKHLAQLPAFSRMDIVNGGGRGCINATTQQNGPSWRMVVALGENVKAYGLYPGGQSGNPSSKYYDNMINKWAKGELNELIYMKTKDDKSAKIIGSWKLVNK